MMRPGLCNPGRAFAGRAAGTSFSADSGVGLRGPGRRWAHVRRKPCSLPGKGSQVHARHRPARGASRRTLGLSVKRQQGWQSRQVARWRDDPGERRTGCDGRQRQLAAFHEMPQWEGNLLRPQAGAQGSIGVTSQQQRRLQKRSSVTRALSEPVRRNSHCRGLSAAWLRWHPTRVRLYRPEQPTLVWPCEAPCPGAITPPTRGLAQQNVDHRDGAEVKDMTRPADKHQQQVGDHDDHGDRSEDEERDQPDRQF
jgi:hypothetical protein